MTDKMFVSHFYLLGGVVILNGDVTGHILGLLIGKVLDAPS
jgi:hypothetical protein